MMDLKILKGNIIYTKNSKGFNTIENGYIVIKNGIVQRCSNVLPDKYDRSAVTDYRNMLIIPGLNDLHCHASQFNHTGIGMDKELVPWLFSYTFPEEKKFEDLAYAENTYKNFINELWKNGSTRSAVWATLHRKSTDLLLELFIKSGLGAFVGKVNMDTNSPEFLSEDTDTSLNDTEYLLKKYLNKSSLVKPIITPRFIPTSSENLLKGVSELSKKYNIPVQSHLSENLDEINWVKKLYPELSSYGAVYDQFGLFGQRPTLMAHCVHSSTKERNLMKNRGVFAVHCPSSNLNLGSGIMPIRKFLNDGIPVALGTDIGAGNSCSMLDIMVSAIQLSKIIWMESKKKLNFLSTAEAFYLATKGGGSFFGNVGSFEKGYEFDALVIDDSCFGIAGLSLEERIQKFIYRGDDRNILHRYVCGNLVEEPFPKNKII